MPNPGKWILTKRTAVLSRHLLVFLYAPGDQPQWMTSRARALLP